MCINVQQTKKFARILYNPTDYPKIRATNSSLPYSPRGALRLRMLTATQTRSKSGTLSDCLPDALHNIPNILIRHIRTCRQAETDLEQVLLHTICIYRSSRIHRLLVHRLPNRTALNLLGKHEHAQSLHILIRLTIRRRAVHRMNHTCSTANSRLDDLLVSIILTLNMNLRGQRRRTKPEIRIITRIKISISYLFPVISAGKRKSAISNME